MGVKKSREKNLQLTKSLLSLVFETLTYQQTQHGFSFNHL